MLRLLVFLIFLVVSVWAGIFFINHPGFVFLVFQPWMVQMPVWFAVISLIIAFFLFYLLISSFDRVQFWCYRIKNWLRFRREQRSYSKTQHGLALLIEGRFKKAERLLISGANQSVEPLMNYLGAARAAQEQGAMERRDQYIKTAYEIAPTAEFAIGITQAELEIEQQHYEQAAATLNRLRDASPRHPRVLRLLEKAYVHLGDWQHLQAILPSLRKAKVLNSQQTEWFEKNLYCELLRAASTKSLEAVRQVWDDMPRSARKNPDVVCAYVLQLQRFKTIFNLDKEIEELIRQTLKHAWQPRLALIYGLLTYPNVNRQLVVAGAWLKAYGQKPELLLTLGRLCVRAQLWGKAKDYFERCLAQGPNPAAYLEYGKLLEHLGENEDALQKYKDGLLQATMLDEGVMYGFTGNT